MTESEIQRDGEAKNQKEGSEQKGQSEREQPQPSKGKTRRGGQCRRGTQKSDGNTLTGKDLPLVVNISSKNLDTHQLAVLQKGLSFCPMYKFNSFELNMDLQRFYRNIRLRVHFSEQPTIPTSSGRDKTLLELCDLGLRTPSSYMPPRSNPPVETFVSLVERDIHTLTREMDRGKFQFHTNLTQSERLSLEQLSSDKSLIIKPADKGGATVVMDRSDYLEEVFRQLGDTTVYKIIQHNPLNQLIKKIAPIIDFHYQAGTIDSKLRDFLIKRDPITPIFYVLPKIHKRLVKPPGRPIVSLTDSVLSPLSMVLEKILTPLVKTTRSFLLDTNDFIQIIKSLGPISPSSLLITWDVNSLCTSIVHEKGLAATDRLLHDNKIDIKIRHLCADLLGLVLKENYFLFQDTFYAQQQGTAMGANVAPPYAVAYMANFEQDFVYNHPLFMSHCMVWRRYIDDIFCIWDGPIESLLSFDQHINGIWPELKFSIQHDTHRINFLDTLVYKERGGHLAIDLYTKPTDRNGLLFFTSCHPPSIKNSIPKSQFHRVDRIVSDDNLKQTRLIEMEHKFADRGYPKGILTEAKRNMSSSKTRDNPKRIPFVSTFHPFSGLVQSTIRRHWNILTKSYPNIAEFRLPFLSCYKRARNLKDRLVKADIGPSTLIPKQAFLHTQRRGTFPCLNCLQCSNVQKGPSVFHPQTGRAIPIKGFYTCESTFVVYLIKCPCGLAYVGETTQTTDGHYFWPFVASPERGSRLTGHQVGSVQSATVVSTKMKKAGSKARGCGHGAGRGHGDSVPAAGIGTEHWRAHPSVSSPPAKLPRQSESPGQEPSLLLFSESLGLERGGQPSSIRKMEEEAVCSDAQQLCLSESEEAGGPVPPVSTPQYASDDETQVPLSGAYCAAVTTQEKQLVEESSVDDEVLDPSWREVQEGGGSSSVEEIPRTGQRGIGRGKTVVPVASTSAPIRSMPLPKAKTGAPKTCSAWSFFDTVAEWAQVTSLHCSVAQKRN
ncbi:unnamed protein product [Ranitomeya imitator]|uniref:Helix-turn-helix domain-containing protein n=1 Tax=Ranitomeya imitator TaxID=111125 RepID=A0ABN9LNA0_9NEOB|nr:unnamed protein product [Ranitomeya imitator]